MAEWFWGTVGLAVIIVLTMGAMDAGGKIKWRTDI